MNRIEYNGKLLLDLDEVKDKYTKSEVDTKITEAKNEVLESVDTDGMVTSNTITRIEVVTEYPETQETGVLYIKTQS